MGGHVLRVTFEPCRLYGDGRVREKKWGGGAMARGGYRGGSLGAEEPPPLWKNTLQAKQGQI